MIRVYSSSDEEDENTRIPQRLLVTLSQYTEPRNAVERAIMSENPPAERKSRAAAGGDTAQFLHLQGAPFGKFIS